MEDTNNIVDITIKQRQACVLGFEHFPHEYVDILFDIQTENFIAGNHNIFNGDILQVENTFQHALVTVGDFMARDIDYRAQLFGIQSVIPWSTGVKAEQFYQPVSQFVNHPHQRPDKL